MVGKHKPRIGKWAVLHKMKKPNGVRTVRNLIRQHLRQQGLQMAPTLMEAWGAKTKNVVYMKMYREGIEPLYPHHIDGFCRVVGLGPEERHEMMVLGAREWGFEVDDPFAKNEGPPPVVVESLELARTASAMVSKLLEHVERIAQGKKS